MGSEKAPVKNACLRGIVTCKPEHAPPKKHMQCLTHALVPSPIVSG